ncbi:MAG: hemolysin, partial [Flavobacteriaceae bacterium]|nr:hemolysin [Flavobacteriaceae bacterium]
EVDYINETYKIDLPEGENYETLGGLIVDFTEEIPQQDEIVTIENFEFKILEVSNTKIDLVALKIKEED